MIVIISQQLVVLSSGGAKDNANIITRHINRRHNTPSYDLCTCVYLYAYNFGKEEEGALSQSFSNFPRAMDGSFTVFVGGGGYCHWLWLADMVTQLSNLIGIADPGER